MTASVVAGVSDPGYSYSATVLQRQSRRPVISERWYKSHQRLMGKWLMPALLPGGVRQKDLRLQLGSTPTSAPPRAPAYCGFHENMLRIAVPWVAAKSGVGAVTTTAKRSRSFQSTMATEVVKRRPCAA